MLAMCRRHSLQVMISVVEGLSHLRPRSRKSRSSCRWAQNRINRKAMGFQPIGDGGAVVLGRPKGLRTNSLAVIQW